MIVVAVEEGMVHASAQFWEKLVTFVKKIKPFCNEGRKEMFYLMMHSTHFIYGYMVKYHSDSERKPAAATWATLSD